MHFFCKPRPWSSIIITQRHDSLPAHPLLQPRRPHGRRISVLHYTHRCTLVSCRVQACTEVNLALHLRFISPAGGIKAGRHLASFCITTQPHNALSQLHVTATSLTQTVELPHYRILPEGLTVSHAVPVTSCQGSSGQPHAPCLQPR